MAVRRICVRELTTVTQTQTLTVTCASPSFTPTGTGNQPECNVNLYNVSFSVSPVPTITFSYDAQFKYTYDLNGGSFEEFCNVLNQSGSIILDAGLGSCTCSDAFTITSSVTCDPTAITTTDTSVAAPVTFNFTLNDLCAETIICVDDTTCP